VSYILDVTNVSRFFPIILSRAYSFACIATNCERTCWSFVCCNLHSHALIKFELIRANRKDCTCYSLFLSSFSFSHPPSLPLSLPPFLPSSLPLSLSPLSLSLSVRVCGFNVSEIHTVPFIEHLVQLREFTSSLLHWARYIIPVVIRDYKRSNKSTFTHCIKHLNQYQWNMTCKHCWNAVPIVVFYSPND